MAESPGKQASAVPGSTVGGIFSFRPYLPIMGPLRVWRSGPARRIFFRKLGAALEPEPERLGLEQLVYLLALVQ